MGKKDFKKGVVITFHSDLPIEEKNEQAALARYYVEQFAVLFDLQICRNIFVNQLVVSEFEGLVGSTFLFVEYCSHNYQMRRMHHKAVEILAERLSSLSRFLDVYTCSLPYPFENLLSDEK